MGNKRNYPETLIVSVGQPGNINCQDSLDLIEFLEDNGYSYKRVSGIVNGLEECSLVVVPRTEDRRKSLIGEVLLNYEQDHVILLDYKRDAYAISLVGRERLGEFVAADKSEVTDSCTYCAKTDTTYIIKSQHKEN